MPKSLYLIRHGETDWSRSGQHTGRTEVSLTPQGEDSARELGQRIRDIRFSTVLTSPRQRAQRTCELAGLTQIAIVDPDLTEWNYGMYEGQRSVDIAKERPDWNLFRDGCPGGESPDEISLRADRLIARIRSLEGTVALFSHGHFCRVLAARWIGSPVDVGQHLQLSTASISILGNEPRHPEVPVIALWNLDSLTGRVSPHGTISTPVLKSFRTDERQRLARELPTETIWHRSRDLKPFKP